MHRIFLLSLILIPLASSVRQYEQCAGEGYRGSTVCDPPLQCFRRSRWFSSCQVKCPGLDWECAKTGGPNTNGARGWDQCGGQGWNGPTYCTEFTCQARSIWYSQCRPDCPVGWACSGNPTPIATGSSTVGTTQYVSSTTASTTWILTDSTTPSTTASTTWTTVQTATPGSTAPTSTIIVILTTPSTTASLSTSSSTEQTTFTMPLITMPPES